MLPDNENKQQIFEIINLMPQMVWVTDSDGRIVYCNQRWLDYAGLSRADIAGEKLKKYFHPEEAESLSDLWGMHLKSGKPFEVHFRLRESSTARYRWHLCRAVPVYERDRIREWIVSNTDVDNQKHAEDQLIAARNQAEEANKAKSEFMANMSHEIRTPLNAIMGLASILGRSTPLSGKQREFINTLQTSADSMLTLINDLLDISRIESRTIEFEKIPFDLEHIMEEIMSMMKNECREKGLELTMDTQCIQDRILEGDPARLRQVILNLCSNAIKYTESGGVHITVSCQPVTKEGTQHISIAVADTGIGIPEDKRDVIFEKFVHGDMSVNRKYGSTGLGLAITRTLAESMGGTITVESELGKGSTFTLSVELPVIKITQPDKFNQAADLNYLKPPEDQTILIVEDYAPNALVAGSYLEEFGYRYDIASNGRDAMNKVKEAHYQAVLMDVQMPGMNGLETTQAIRTYEKLLGKGHLHIIGLTAHAMPGDRERCLEAGMDDYISKPFSPNELRKKLEARTYFTA
ncbi:MAG: ATP-binding protein [Micavibrio sp.]